MEMNRMKSNEKVLGMVQLAFFSAIIIIMALVPFLGYIPLGVTRATIIHIPVIIGAIVLGPKRGAFLGALFGLTSLLTNTFNPTVTSFVFTPFYSVGDMRGNGWSLVICFLPRILVGIVPYYVFKGVRRLMRKVESAETVPLILAGLAGSLTNTILVMNMIFLFFRDGYANAKNIAVETLYSVILGVIGVNGVPEAIVAAVLTLAVGKALLKSAKTKPQR